MCEKIYTIRVFWIGRPRATYVMESREAHNFLDQLCEIPASIEYINVQVANI